MPDKNVAVDPTLVGIAVAIAEIRQSQEDLRRELLGNGQPGRLQKIESEVSDLKSKHWYVTSGLIVISHGLREALRKFGLF